MKSRFFSENTNSPDQASGHPAGWAQRHAGQEQQRGDLRKEFAAVQGLRDNHERGNRLNRAWQAGRMLAGAAAAA